MVKPADPRVVERLKKYLQDKHASKEAYEAAMEKAMARQKEIDAAPDNVKMEFYCSCHGDFVAIADKIHCTTNGLPDAYYQPNTRLPGMFVHHTGRLLKAFHHPCKKSRRWITGKAYDPYFQKSKLIRYQRAMAIDKGWLLQPGDAGFTTKYGDPYAKQYAERERQERMEWIRTKHS